MARINGVGVAMVLVAMMAVGLVATLLVAQKAEAGIIIDDGLCLSGPEICPPDTNITSGPSQGAVLDTASVTFGFSSTESPSTFECKLDGAAFEGCTSPRTYTGLADGSHTFQVRATDPQGKVDSSPASRTWSIATAQPLPDTTAPSITLSTPPDGTTYDLNQTVTADYSCQEEADGSGVASCQGTVPNGSAVDTATLGTKSFTVSASDNAGNASSVTHTYTIVGSSQCTRTGTEGPEILKGTPGADVICGLGGNDTIKALGGNDTLKGGDGTDKLFGGPGDDTLDGGLGADTASYSASLTGVTASLATDSSTGEGADSFSGVENLLGSSKADTLTGSAANNTLKGGGGDDVGRGGSGNDKVFGEGGADELFGEDGADKVNSQDGVNGNDSLDGGAGTDTKVTDATERSIVGFP